MFNISDLFNVEKNDLSLAVSYLRAGKVVAFPTETVYGLGAPVFSPHTIEKIFTLKNRPPDNPLIVHVSNFKQIELVSDSFSEKLARKFWPGPLTLVLPKKKSVPSIVSAGLQTVGVRMPSHPIALKLIEMLGQPLVAPSANLSGKPSSTKAEHVREDFGDQVFVLDGGSCLQGIESTVLSLNPLRVLRPGVITKEELESVLGEKIPFGVENVIQIASPGMKYKHYAPQARVILAKEDETVLPAERRLILNSIKSKQLYTLFREADKKGIKEIVIICNQKIKSNAALMDRLIRAAQ